MVIKVPTKPWMPTQSGQEERAEAAIAGGDAPRQGGGKTVVNSRWDAELLRQIDQAARKQGISRTAWLHVAAAEKLAR